MIRGRVLMSDCDGLKQALQQFAFYHTCSEQTTKQMASLSPPVLGKKMDKVLRIIVGVPRKRRRALIRHETDTGASWMSSDKSCATSIEYTQGFSMWLLLLDVKK